MKSSFNCRPYLTEKETRVVQVLLDAGFHVEGTIVEKVTLRHFGHPELWDHRTPTIVLPVTASPSVLGNVFYMAGGLGEYPVADSVSIVLIPSPNDKARPLTQGRIEIGFKVNHTKTPDEILELFIPDRPEETSSAGSSESWTLDIYEYLTPREFATVKNLILADISPRGNVFERVLRRYFSLPIDPDEPLILTVPSGHDHLRNFPKFNNVKFMAEVPPLTEILPPFDSETIIVTWGTSPLPERRVSEFSLINSSLQLEVGISKDEAEAMLENPTADPNRPEWAQRRFFDDGLAKLTKFEIELLERLSSQNFEVRGSIITKLMFPPDISKKLVQTTTLVIKTHWVVPPSYTVSSIGHPSETTLHDPNSDQRVVLVVDPDYKPILALEDGFIHGSWFYHRLSLESVARFHQTGFFRLLMDPALANKRSQYLFELSYHDIVKNFTTGPGQVWHCVVEDISDLLQNTPGIPFRGDIIGGMVVKSQKGLYSDILWDTLRVVYPDSKFWFATVSPMSPLDYGFVDAKGQLWHRMTSEELKAAVGLSGYLYLNSPSIDED